MPITLLKSCNEYLLLNFEPNDEFNGKIICQVPFTNDIVYESLVRLVSKDAKLKSKNENVAVFDSLNEHNISLRIMDFLSSSITPKPQFSATSSEDNGEYIDSYYSSSEFTRPLIKSDIKTGIIIDISNTEDGEFYILVEYGNSKQDWFSVDENAGPIYETLKEVVEIEDLKIQKIDGEYHIVN